MNQRPPKLAEKILKKLLYDDVWKTTLGDFEEYYQHLHDKKGKKAADTWYWKQVLRYAPSKLVHKLVWSAEMFRSYMKVAYRSIRKNKTYSVINISGLAIGLASFLLIGIYVIHELSYDSHFEESENIYQLVREAPGEMYLESNLFAVNPLPLSIALADDYPGIEASTAVYEGTALFSHNTNSFFENGLSTDKDFFRVFPRTWIYGSPETAFEEPESIVLTASLAKKYFRGENPVGKTINVGFEYDDPSLRTVSGVVEDVRSNSNIQFDFLVPDYSLENYERESTSWASNNINSFIRIDGSLTPQELEQSISSLSDRHLTLLDYYADNKNELSIYQLQPVKDVHLKSTHINFTIGKPGDIKYVYMLSLVAIIILIVACVNYMNLATARSMNRTKEVGVRKVNGAFRSNIMMQFSAEAVLFSMIGTAVAFFIVYLTLPAFSSLLDRNIDAQILLTPIFWIVLIAIGATVGIISGSYPAFFMSALKPSGIFKNQIKGGKGNRMLRNGLVIAQFTITNILIIASIVIFKQLDYIKTRDSGFDREQVLTVKVTDPEFMGQYDAIKSSLESRSDIIRVSSARNTPSQIRSQTSGISWDGKDEDTVLRTYNARVNIGYIELLGIELLAGRSFNENMDTYDSQHFVVNETFARSIGWTPEEAVGKPLEFWKNEGEIIGVIQDFNFLSYHMEQAPLLLRYEDIAGRAELLIKVNTDNLTETIAFVEQQAKTISPSYPFEYSFLDDAFNRLYQNELILGRIFNYFTVLALIIACMGLFGLAAFMMELRTKEIGIRKVLGADIFQIVTLLNKDFLKLIVISFLIAAPVGWYLSNNWLEGFAYRISVGPMIFLVTGLGAIGIALITVSFKSIKTALANPVDSLKSE